MKKKASPASGRSCRPWRGDASLRDYIGNVIRNAPSPWKRCLRAFVLWLENERGLAVSSVVVRVHAARVFVEALEGPGGVRTLKHLGVTDIEDFFVDYSKTHGIAARRSMQAAMRLFIRFTVSRNWAGQELLGSVPSLRAYRLSSLPRGLSDDQVRILAVTSRDRSARDHAIVLLLLAYGIRRGQVVALRLEDVNWRERTIVFRAHKNGKPVQHHLAPAVAAALSTYLRTERPDVVERAVFLRSSSPYLPLGPSAVTAMVRDLLRRADLTCNPHGPHALRHAFATRMLNRGHTLKSIADLLGHRSLEAVSVYAKVDHPRLLEVALEWPEVLA
jgi:integrase/recombinase XerD